MMELSQSREILCHSCAVFWHLRSFKTHEYIRTKLPFWTIIQRDSHILCDCLSGILMNAQYLSFLSVHRLLLSYVKYNHFPRVWYILCCSPSLMLPTFARSSVINLILPKVSETHREVEFFWEVSSDTLILLFTVKTLNVRLHYNSN